MGSTAGIPRQVVRSRDFRLQTREILDGENKFPQTCTSKAAIDMSDQTATKTDLKGPDVYERLCRARAYIDLCYDLPLKLDEISSQACFSRYHFLRLFRQAFNKTPHQYLVERRIEKAKELLGSNELRVTDICFEVGFQSLGSFSSLFHKTVGHPPITYREKMRESESARRQVPGCFLMMYKLEPTVPAI